MSNGAKFLILVVAGLALVACIGACGKEASPTANTCKVVNLGWVGLAGTDDVVTVTLTYSDGEVVDGTFNFQVTDMATNVRSDAGARSSGQSIHLPVDHPVAPGFFLLEAESDGCKTSAIVRVPF